MRNNIFYLDTVVPAKSSSTRAFVSCMFLVSIIVYSLYKGFIIFFLAVPRRYVGTIVLDLLQIFYVFFLCRRTIPIDTPQQLMARLDEVTPIARINIIAYYVIRVRFLQQNIHLEEFSL